MVKKSKLSKIFKNAIPFFVVLVVLIIFNYSSDFSKKTDLTLRSVMASEDDNMSGYAWSDNIGWISFNCQDGGPVQNDICSTSDYGVGIGDKEAIRLLEKNIVVDPAEKRSLFKLINLYFLN